MSHKVQVKMSVTDNDTGIETIEVDYKENDVSILKVLELEGMLLAGIGTRLESTKNKVKAKGPK